MDEYEYNKMNQVNKDILWVTKLYKIRHDKAFNLYDSN